MNNEKAKDKIKELKKQLEEANEKILLLQVSEPMLEYKKSIRKKSTKRVYRVFRKLFKIIR